MGGAREGRHRCVGGVSGVSLRRGRGVGAASLLHERGFSTACGASLLRERGPTGVTAAWN